MAEASVQIIPVQSPYDINCNLCLQENITVQSLLLSGYDINLAAMLTNLTVTLEYVSNLQATATKSTREQRIKYTYR